MSKGIIQNI